MTFIASVIAKEGVAIIADSLVTTLKPVIDWEDFSSFITKKKEDSGEEDITFTPDELRDLFKYKESHTRNYEEKLFQLDKFTALTTTGIAVINNKRMSKFVNEFIHTKESWDEVPLVEKIGAFKGFLEINIKEHLAEHNDIDSLRFIVTHYSVNDEKTTIHTFNVVETDIDSLGDPDFQYVTFKEESAWKKVVCDGQNKISDRLLFGNFLEKMNRILPKIVDKICEDCKYDKALIPAEYCKEFFHPGDQFTSIVVEDMEIINLTPLSLQQAVDLAWLLMRLETDFQKYTKNVQTVGGIIKLATIDKNGFNFISGDKIQLPTTF